MERKLDIKLIFQISNLYINHFIHTLKESKDVDKPYPFYEVLLGFLYAGKRLLCALEILKVMDVKQIQTIETLLSDGAKKDIPEMNVIDILQEQVKGVKDGCEQ